MELLLDGGMKVCSNSPGYMTKMVAMPNMFKNLKIFFFRAEWPRSLKLGMKHRTLEYYQVHSDDDPRLTLDLFTQKSNLVPYAFVWENV